MTNLDMSLHEVEKLVGTVTLEFEAWSELKIEI